MPRRRKKLPASATPADVVRLNRDRQPDGGAPAHSIERKAVDLQSRFRTFAGAIPPLPAVVASINSIANGFVYDDLDQVLNNRLIKSLSNLPIMFTTSVWAFKNNQLAGADDFYYRPIFGCFFTLCYALSGTTAWIWHLANVAIYAADAFFVYVLIKEISSRSRLALVTALLFAIHPVHSESVAWVSGAPDPLMAFFVLPSLYLYIRYRKSGGRLKLLLSVLLYLPAMFSKETAVVVPIILLSWEAILSGDRTKLWERVRGLSARVVLFCIPIFTYFAMRAYVIGRLTPPALRLSFIDGLRTMPKALAKYLGLAIFPAGYNMQHITTPVQSVWAADFIVPVLILVTLAILILLTRSKLLLFAGIWFVVWLLPVLGALRMFFSIHGVLERYLYLPSIGICLAAALGIEWIASREILARYRPVPEIALSSAVFVVLVAAFVQQNAVWKDNLTLYRRAVEVSPDSALAHNALSTQYELLDRWDDSLSEAKLANELDPHCLDAYLNLAYLAGQKGDNKTAFSYMERARNMVRDGPLKRAEIATICVNQAALHQQLREYDQAEQDLVEATNLLPGSSGILERLGDFYYDRGQYGHALEIFLKVSQGVTRGYAPIHLKLARTYERLGDPVNARVRYQDYLRVAPAADDVDEIRRRLSRL